MTAVGSPVIATPTPLAHRCVVWCDAHARAVLRDLRRLARVLAEPVTAVRRQALIKHTSLLLDELSDLHRLYDETIWPAAVVRQADLSDLAKQAGEAHLALREPLDAVRTAVLPVRAATDGRSATGSRLALRAAVDHLADQLELVIEGETELLPLAWQVLAIEDTAAISRRLTRPMLPTRLGWRMFWLLDELDADRAAALLQPTPPLVMWILRNGFSGAYNRGAYLMWVGGGNGPAE